MLAVDQARAHRPVVTGRQGAIASAHPLASMAGLFALQQGGNAVDAAVAVAAALNVVEPNYSGAGGVGYMLIHMAGQERPLVLDYTGQAPRAASVERFAGEAAKDDGIMSSLVPGALGGWLAALDRFGTMSRAKVFAPAIELAEQGFRISGKNIAFMANYQQRLARWPTTARIFLEDGQPLRDGSVLRQADLARTFRQIVESGADTFYRGEIASEIVRFSREHGGLLTEDDLASYAPRWEVPVSTHYRGHEVFCPPPPCSGMEYLQTLNIVEGFDMAGMGHNSADYIHHLAEAMKLALADRTTYAASAASPIDGLLSSAYASVRRCQIDPHMAGYSGGERFTSVKQPGEIRPGSPASLDRENTTHFVTVDAAGNSVACTQSLGSGFGSAIVHGDTGLLLNNFAFWFDLDPQSPNVIGPNKKVEMCLAPSQVWRDGRPFLMVGTPGSFGITQTTPQMIMNVIDHGFNIQAAIEAPRIRTQAGRRLVIEDRVSEHVVSELRRRGHEVELIDSWSPFMGGAQGIVVEPVTGMFCGGADPRRDGYALAY